MNALSLWQPWATLLSRGHDHPAGKRVENRSWPMPKAVAGKWCLIHAAKLSSMDDWLWAANLAKAAGIGPPLHGECPCGGIVGAVRWGDASVECDPSAWFGGPYGWPTMAAVALPFRLYRGRQRIFQVGLFNLTDEAWAILERAGAVGGRADAHAEATQ